MSETHFGRRLFGRLIRPVALCLMLSLLVMVWATTMSTRGGPNLLDAPGDIIAAVSLAAAAALMWGWLTQQEADEILNSPGGHG